MHEVSASNQESALTFTPSSASSPASYLYAILPVLEYTVYVDGDTSTFRVDGKPEYYTVSSDSIGANTVTISGFKTITNANTSENFIVSTLKYEIYRTEANETSFYLVASITNGTASYIDSSTDITIADNRSLYTDADTQENAEPPMARTLDVCNDVLFLGNCYARTRASNDSITYAYYPNRVRYSIPGALDHLPEDFFEDFEFEVTANSHVGRIPLVFGRNKLYRLDGTVDEFGAGAYIKEKIHDAIGTLSPNGCVRVGSKLYFIGNDGIYLTDGYVCLKISTHLNDYFKDLLPSMSDADKRLIYGEYDVKEQRILWTMKRDGASELNFLLVLDLSQGESDAMPFVTWSGRAYDYNKELLGYRFSPQALVYFNDEMVMCAKFYLGADLGSTEQGVYKFDQASFSDSSITTTTLYPIIYRYVSVAYSLGTSVYRKFVTKTLLTLANHGDISTIIQSNNNDGTSVKDLKEIRTRYDIEWGVTPIVWGDPDFIWNYSGVFERVRRFPARELRCTYKQIIITNAYTIIQASDDFGTATVASLNPTSNTALLEQATDYDWSVNAVGYYITFSADSYTKKYPITIRSADTLTYTDTSKESPQGTTKKWQLEGFKVDELFEMLSYVIYYSPLSPSHRSYHGSADLGANQ